MVLTGPLRVPFASTDFLVGISERLLSKRALIFVARRGFLRETGEFNGDTTTGPSSEEAEEEQLSS